MTEEVKLHAIEHHEVDERLFVLGGNRNYNSALALPKEVSVGTNFHIRGDIKAQSALHGRFQHGDKETAFGHVVRRSNHAFADEFLELLLVGVLFLQGKEGNGRSLNAVVVHQVLAGRNIVARRTQHVNQVALGFERNRGHVLRVFYQTNHRDGGRWEDRLDAVANLRLVVKAHVAPGHRGRKLLTGFAHALDGADKLPVHFRIVGVAKVQTVGDSRGYAAGTDDVSGIFSDRNHGAHFGVGMHVAAVAIYGHGNGALGAFDIDNGGIARFVGGAVLGAHHGVVLFVDPALGGDVGQAGQL